MSPSGPCGFGRGPPSQRADRGFPGRNPTAMDVSAVLLRSNGAPEVLCPCYILSEVSRESDGPSGGQSVQLTALLNRICEGDRSAGEQAVSLVYEELHRLASREMRREQPGHTLQTTALIHEAYLKLTGSGSLQVRSRGHFFAIASQQMRRILVDHARASGTQKRGAGAVHLDADSLPVCAGERGADLLALDDALSALEGLDPQAAHVVEL